MLKRVKYYLRIYVRLMVRSYMMEMAYRLNFLVSILSTVVSFTTTIIFFNIIYFRVEDLAGWKKYDLLLLFGVYLLVKGVFEMSIRKGLDRLPSYVVRGSFDSMLLRPLNTLFLISFNRLDFDDLVEILIGILTMNYALSKLALNLDPLMILGFVISLVSGVIILYSNYLMIMSTTFWTLRVEYREIYKNLLQMTRIPPDVYSGRVRFILTYLIPLAFLVMFPTQVLLGRLPFWLVLTTPLFALINFYLAWRFWLFALRNYSGASS